MNVIRFLVIRLIVYDNRLEKDNRGQTTFFLSFALASAIFNRMPRRPRIIVPGVPLHIIQRGNNRQACFFAEEDNLFYLDWLAEYANILSLIHISEPTRPY